MVGRREEERKDGAMEQRNEMGGNRPYLWAENLASARALGGCLCIVFCQVEL